MLTAMPGVRLSVPRRRARAGWDQGRRASGLTSVITTEDLVEHGPQGPTRVWETPRAGGLRRLRPAGLRRDRSDPGGPVMQTRGAAPSPAAARQIGMPAQTSETARRRNPTGNGLGTVHSPQARSELRTFRGNSFIGQVAPSIRRSGSRWQPTNAALDRDSIVSNSFSGASSRFRMCSPMCCTSRSTRDQSSIEYPSTSAASKVRSRNQPGPDISLRLRGEPTVGVWIQRSTTTGLLSDNYPHSVDLIKNTATLQKYQRQPERCS